MADHILIGTTTEELKEAARSSRFLQPKAFGELNPDEITDEDCAKATGEIRKAILEDPQMKQLILAAGIACMAAMADRKGIKKNG